MPLLYALRNDVGLNNPHFGCGLAQCGACTVHLDGQPTRSCVTPLSAVGEAKVVTLAGLGTPEQPHPLQTAYVEEQVLQCGYCINGWLMTAAAFLRDNKKPSEAQIKDALSGLKCRPATSAFSGGQACRRDDGLRERAMTKFEAASLTRRSVLLGGGALVVSVGAGITIETPRRPSDRLLRKEPSRR